MATSIITHTITGPTGTALSAVPVIIRLVPRGAFRTADGSEVAPTYVTTTNASGVWSATLERNSGISPANSFYEVEQQLSPAQGGPRKYTFQVGAGNATLFASLISPIPDTAAAGYITQASADARYVLSPGSYATVGNIADSRPNDSAAAGVLTTYARGDHMHDRETQRGTAATLAALTGTDLIQGQAVVTTDANNITGAGIATPDTTSQPARTDSMFVKNAQRFQPGYWNQPWGVMGFITKTTNQTGITTQTDITGVTLTFTAAANRRYKVSLYCRAQQITSPSNNEVYITTAANALLQVSSYNHAANDFVTHHAVVILSPAAGSVTYKARAATGAGTSSILCDATYPLDFWIEDIGPNGAPA
jgi:putative SOS response-associated peptidase YedK